MRISINCKSQILEKTLKIYLKKNITSIEDCDFIISDDINNIFNKDVCFISFNDDTNIKRPFSKESLLSDLANFFNNKNQVTYENKNIEQITNNINQIDNEKLKEELEIIIREFTNKIYQLIKK